MRTAAAASRAAAARVPCADLTDQGTGLRPLLRAAGPAAAPSSGRLRTGAPSAPATPPRGEKDPSLRGQGWAWRGNGDLEGLRRREGLGLVGGGGSGGLAEVGQEGVGLRLVQRVGELP